MSLLGLPLAVGYPGWDLSADSSEAGRGFAKVSPPPLPLALHLGLARLNPWRNPPGQGGLTRQGFELQNTPERATKCR